MDTEEESKQETASKIPLLVAISAGSILGSVLFALTFSGFILQKHSPEENEPEIEQQVNVEPLPDLQFVPIEPLMVSLGAAASGKQLRFEGYLEVEPKCSFTFSRPTVRLHGTAGP